MNKRSLADLQQGDRCTVEIVELPDGQRRRLRDLGLLPGAVIGCGYVAPSGSPMAFWIKGALIALRREDCQKIRITRSDRDED